MTTHSLAKLMEEVLKLSKARDWEEAKEEWTWEGVEEEEANCLCGHSIFENCQIVNRVNGNRAIVGNVCINHFLGVRADLVFDGLRRIRYDHQAAANEALIDKVRDMKVIDAWEYGFLMSTKRKRVLSGRQAAMREKLNRRILRHVGGVN